MKRQSPVEDAPERPAKSTPEMLPQIVQDHTDKTLKLLPPERSNIALKIQPRIADAIQRSKEFAFKTRPSVITSWKVQSMLKIDLPSTVFTMIDPARRNADPPVGTLAAWEPMVPIQGSDTDGYQRHTFANINAEQPIHISARDNSRGYIITKGVSSGTYGVVYFATATKDSRQVALKFIKVIDKAIMDIQDEDNGSHTKIISPGFIPGLFTHYVLQRSYGGCMPLTVCLYDTFLFVKPSTANPKGPLSWYIVMAMEKMKSSVDRFVISPQIYRKDPAQKFKECMMLFAKMTRSIYDLELQAIFHNDIKPQNFLYNDSGAVKVTDFDLGGFASRMSGMGYDPTLLLRDFITYNTDGAVVTDRPPWVYNSALTKFMRCMYRTTEYYEPPEYALLTALFDAANHQRQTEITINTLNNATWLSKMMAYQLICTFRELILSSGLNFPYFGAGGYGSYVLDVKDTRGPRNDKASAHKYIKMNFSGEYAIAPTHSDPFTAYKEVRMSSIYLPPIRDPEVKDVAERFNGLLATVIAPKTPTPKDTATTFPLDPITFLCETSDSRVHMSRPTVPKLLDIMTVLIQKLKIILPDMPGIGARVPANIEEELATAIRAARQ